MFFGLRKLRIGGGNKIYTTANSSANAVGTPLEALKAETLNSR